jgi:hypothetical protein
MIAGVCIRLRFKMGMRSLEAFVVGREAGGGDSVRVGEIRLAAADAAGGGDI